MTRDSARRPHPFDLIFGDFRDQRLPAIAQALGQRDDVSEFLLAGPALELLRDLRPDAGLDTAVDDFVALVHAAYRYWRDGEQTVAVDEDRTRQLCRAGAGVAPAIRPSATRYIQVAPRLIWGQLDDAEPFEPLDGWFATVRDQELTMVACFGVHEQRPGTSISVVSGAMPLAVERADGSPLFSPTMPGGDAAHLHAVSTPGELLLLGWRAPAGEEIA